MDQILEKLFLANIKGSEVILKYKIKIRPSLKFFLFSLVLRQHGKIVPPANWQSKIFFTTT